MRRACGHRWIRCRSTPTIEWPNDEASRRKTPVTITMRNGQTFTRTVEKVRGSPGNPMTRDELLGKYRGCASRILKGERLEQSIAMLETLETVPAAKDLVAALTL